MEQVGGGSDDTDWVRRPFARTFDLISSQYGWTDSQILDLTLGRLRQVRDVIATRRNEEFLQRVSIEEAKIRLIAGSVFAAAGNAKGAKAASEVRLLEQDSEQVRREQYAMAVFRPDPVYGLIPDEAIEREKQRILAERNGHARS